VDTTAGSALVTGYFTGRELKHLLDYFLVDNPTHPGEWFPRASGLRFRYDLSRPAYDAVTAIELGDLDRGYRAIDISGKDKPLYSFTCPLMLAPLIMALPQLTKGKLAVVPKNKEGQPLKSRVEALVDIPRRSSAQLMPPKGTVDKSSIATGEGMGPLQEIKEWQAIMDHLRSLPAGNAGELPIIPVDERAAEVRAIKADGT
jgi:5'-nucleotidase/UDP-sugar diphosphatase